MPVSFLHSFVHHLLKESSELKHAGPLVQAPLSVHESEMECSGGRADVGGMPGRGVLSPFFVTIIKWLTEGDLRKKWFIL